MVIAVHILRDYNVQLYVSASHTEDWQITTKDIANPKIITIFAPTFDEISKDKPKAIRIGSVAQLDRATAF